MVVDITSVIKMYRFTLLLLLIGHSEIYGSIIPKARSGRIFNGVPAEEGEFPFQLNLQMDHRPICGAVIVNEYWALTSCQCVFWNITDEMFLYAGSVELYDGGTTYDVDHIVMHEEYDPANNHKNDIAVVKVKTPFKFDDENVKPVSLPEKGETLADDTVVVATGWGFNSSWIVPTHLQKVNLFILNLDRCNDIYSNDHHIVQSGQFCASDKGDGSHGICAGDTGGPLLVNGTIVGIVSWEEGGCTNGNYPTVFTKVSDYIDWIEEKTAE